MIQDHTYRLASSTVAEPLINRWYAWPYLFSPLTASLHLRNYQIKTMRSYLDDPEVHLLATQDLELVSGPFINIHPDNSGMIKELLAETIKKQEQNLKMAEAFETFYNWIVEEVEGQSLEPYYRLLPQELRGYVELVYDYYNRPTVRCLESLLYESVYYNRNLQSLRLFQLNVDGSRPYFMNTPRFCNDDQIEWKIAFEDAQLDELFKLDIQPRPLNYIQDLFGLPNIDDERLMTLLSEECREPSAPLENNALSIRYFGHACVLIEWNGITIITDPNLEAMPSEGGLSRYSYSDLPTRIDYALITHAHHDHFVLESLLRLRHRIKCLVIPKSYGMLYGDVSLKQMAIKLGFKGIIELDDLESIPLPNGEIIAVPFLGEHSDIAHGKTAYVIRADNEKMLFAADSACLDECIYENIFRALGPVETVFLGMECVGAPLSWHCGSLLLKKPQRTHDQTRRSHGCDSAQGLNLLESIGAKRIYNYAMGMEPWLGHLLGLGLSEESAQIKESNQLLVEARRRGFLAAERLYGKKDIYIRPSAIRRNAIVAPDIQDQFTF